MTELEAVIAEVGRIIESLPRHERRPQVARIVEQMTEAERVDFIIGVFIVAHELDQRRPLIGPKP